MVRFPVNDKALDQRYQNLGDPDLNEDKLTRSMCHTVVLGVSPQNTSKDSYVDAVVEALKQLQLKYETEQRTGVGVIGSFIATVISYKDLL